MDEMKNAAVILWGKWKWGVIKFAVFAVVLLLVVGVLYSMGYTNASEKY